MIQSVGNSAIFRLPADILEKQMELQDKLLRVQVTQAVQNVQAETIRDGISLFA